MTVLQLQPRPKGGCFTCVHHVLAQESWELPHICWHECTARPANENLRGFPWKKTACKLRKTAPEAQG